MALKSPTKTAPTPVFEADPVAATVPQESTTAPAEREARAPEEVKQPAAPSTSTAVATVNPKEAAAVATKFLAEFANMKGSADFSYGTHRVFKGDNGAIREMANDKL